MVEEGIFRAARFGVNGELPDAEGKLWPVSELLDRALERAERHADELGCTQELAHLHDLVERGGGWGPAGHLRDRWDRPPSYGS